MKKIDLLLSAGVVFVYNVYEAMWHPLIQNKLYLAQLNGGNNEFMNMIRYDQFHRFAPWIVLLIVIYLLKTYIVDAFKYIKNKFTKEAQDEI